MAGNTRGKIKEHLEGCHRNFDWIRVHLQKTVILIDEHNPKLTIGIEALAKGVQSLDDLAQGIYGKI